MDGKSLNRKQIDLMLESPDMRLLHQVICKLPLSYASKTVSLQYTFSSGKYQDRNEDHRKQDVKDMKSMRDKLEDLEGKLEEAITNQKVKEVPEESSTNY